MKTLRQHQAELIKQIATAKSNMEAEKSKLLNLKMQLIDIQTQIIKSKQVTTAELRGLRNARNTAEDLYLAFEKVGIDDVMIKIRRNALTVILPKLLDSDLRTANAIIETFNK